MPSKVKNILILGGGFGGVRTAIDLVRAGSALSEYELILIDQERHHLFRPLLYEVASAFVDPCGSPLKGSRTSSRGTDTTSADVSQYCLERGVAIDFELLQKTSFCGRVRVLHRAVTAISAKEKTVSLGSEKIPFAYLVIALGSGSETFGIPGIAEHAFEFRSLDDAVRIHARIVELLQRKRTGKEKRVTIVIGGGGPTGAELAGELASFCATSCAQFGLAYSDFDVTVVEANNRLLSSLHPNVSSHARKRLESLGVTLWLDTCVKKVKSGSVTIAPRPLREGENAQALLCDFGSDHEKMLEADIFIWSGGYRASPILKNSGLLLDAKGRVDVHDTLLAKGETHIFAVGDSAALVDPKTSFALPGLAQVAIFEGTLAAKNIVRSVRGETLAHFSFPFLAHVLPLGGKYAIAVFGRVRLYGAAVYLLRRLIDLKYFFSILPMRPAFKIWWAGWRAYGRNDG